MLIPLRDKKEKHAVPVFVTRIEFRFLLKFRHFTKFSEGFNPVGYVPPLAREIIVHPAQNVTTAAALAETIRAVVPLPSV